MEATHSVKIYPQAEVQGLLEITLYKRKPWKQKKGRNNGQWYWLELDEESNEDIHSLKELCREVIRKYLLQLNPFKTLFKRAPLLGLPRVLTSFLVYDFDLEVKEMEKDSENEKDLSSE